MTSRFSTIEDAVAAIRDGRVIIVVDAEDRENEGDFICAAEKVTPEIVNFMITHGRGPALHADPARRQPSGSKLPPMVETNTAPLGTAYTVPVDHRTRTHRHHRRRSGPTTIRAIVRSRRASPTDFVRPGHLFPLVAKEGGVLRRAGHTEAAVDLARMAGLTPAGVLCEILDEHGDRANRDELLELAREFDLPIISIEELIRYRRVREKLVYRMAEAELPTKYGTGTIIAYGVKYESQEPLVLRDGRPDEVGRAAGAAALVLLHRRPARLAPLRLRRPAAHGPRHDQPRRRRRAGLPAAGRPRHRPGREDQGLRPAGPGARHGRGQPRAGLQGRPPRLRRRHPDAQGPGPRARCAC